MKNAYLRIPIFKISRGSMPPDPPRGGEGRPSPWSHSDHKFWGLRIPRPPPPPWLKSWIRHWEAKRKKPTTTTVNATQPERMIKDNSSCSQPLVCAQSSHSVSKKKRQTSSRAKHMWTDRLRCALWVVALHSCDSILTWMHVLVAGSVYLRAYFSAQCRALKAVAVENWAFVSECVPDVPSQSLTNLNQTRTASYHRHAYWNHKLNLQPFWKRSEELPWFRKNDENKI